MLSFNDAIHSPETNQYTCDNCGDTVSGSLVHWYEAPGHRLADKWYAGLTTGVWDTTVEVVPICPECHCNPSSWLPSASSVNSGDGGSYLQSRDCERLDGPRDWD